MFMGVLGHARTYEDMLAATSAKVRYRRRFTREARLAAQVRGPHVPVIHDFGEIEGCLYVVTDYIEGSTLATLLRRSGALPPQTAVDLVGQIATALDTAHRAGVVHRDVKPSNIMVSSTGVAHLIDFGCAYHADQPTLTLDGNVVGTPRTWRRSVSTASQSPARTSIRWPVCSMNVSSGDGCSRAATPFNRCARTLLPTRHTPPRPTPLSPPPRTRCSPAPWPNSHTTGGLQRANSPPPHTSRSRATMPSPGGPECCGAASRHLSAAGSCAPHG